MRRLACAGTLTIAVGLAGAVWGTQTLFTDFDGFKVGASIDRQNGWGRTGPYDENVVNAGGNTVWRVSNAVTSGSFGDQPFAPRLGGIPLDTVTNPTNDSPGAFAGESSTGTRLKVFKGGFSFRSTTGAAQPGARITVSADNGQGGRQSFIAINDTGTGLEVSTYDVDASGNFIGALGCNLDTPPCPGIVIASGLSYTKWHTTSVEIRFKDGPSNDVVRYFVNGKRVHTDGSWEQFYRAFQIGQHPLGVPVQTLLFRLSSTAHPEFTGGGYYIDNVSLAVSRSGEEEIDSNDRDDDDSDGDGVNDELDTDDDNDGSNDAVDVDDDNDGIEDAYDSKLTHEEQSSYAVALGSGEAAEYALTAGPGTISVTALVADGRSLGMDLLNPLGAVVASSAPSVGRAVLTVPIAATGDYVLRVRNLGANDVVSRLTLIRSDRQ